MAQDAAAAEFENLFASGPPYERVRARALAGELKTSPLRALCWKMFLGVLSSASPCKDWLAEMNAARTRYTELQQRFNIDPHTNTEEQLDPTLDNPLSQSADSRWNAYFENTELQRMINQDIVRTYPEVPFFQRSEVRAMMLRILFVYSKLHPNMSYKQGMHELLAPFVFLLHRNQLPHAEGDANLIANLCSDNFLEHDAFVMFSRLMETTSVWFLSDAPKAEVAKVSSRPTSPVPLSRESSTSAADEAAHSPIVRRCRYIQLQLLREKDPQLQSYLDALNIEPQLYALRWLRLLLGREFELEELLQLWDALFAHSPDLKLIDYLAVAMLIYMRSHLVGHDYNRCMKRLFKFPPVDDVLPFIQSALRMHMEDANPEKKKEAQPSVHAPVPPAAVTSAAPPPTHGPKSTAQSAATKQTSTTHKTVSALATSLSNLWGAEDRRQQEMLQNEITRLRTRDLHMAQRIERIVYSLLKELQESPVSTPEPAMDAVLVAIAELKQVKDILNGLLADDSPARLPPASATRTASPAISTSSPAPAAVASSPPAVASSPPAVSSPPIASSPPVPSTLPAAVPSSSPPPSAPLAASPPETKS